jgi:hypothetical protein
MPASELSELQLFEALPFDGQFEQGPVARHQSPHKQEGLKTI